MTRLDFSNDTTQDAMFILNAMSFIDNEIIPRERKDEGLFSKNQLIARDQHIKWMCFQLLDNLLSFLSVSV